MTNLRTVEGFNPDLFTASELAELSGFVYTVETLREQGDGHRADVLCRKRRRSSDTLKDGPRGEALTTLWDSLDPPEAEPAPDFEAMTVTQLRAAAVQAGLATRGRKAELIERLSG